MSEPPQATAVSGDLSQPETPPKDTEKDTDNIQDATAIYLISPTVSEKMSTSSRASKRSSILAQKQAKADAARTLAEFSVKEAAIIKQQASLDADLHVLKHEGAAAAAEAEVQALEAAENASVKSQSRKSLSVREKYEADPYVSQERTKAYVESPNDVKYEQFMKQENDHERQFNPPAISYHTHLPTNVQPTGPLVANELAKFLLKKDLLLNRLNTFNDRPETYTSWKVSFRSIMTELDASSTEETDLLIKWLGLNSRRQAISLRASYVTDPRKGLDLIWKRLDERYGAPEMIDAAIKEKLHNFPRLTPNDRVKLYELTDILAEIEAIKDIPKFQSLLSYYDSSAGIIPIVSKLPYGIQERWTRQASGYKQRHGVPYPPFYVFCDYMRETSIVKNDPSFMYTHIMYYNPKEDNREPL